MGELCCVEGCCDVYRGHNFVRQLAAMVVSVAVAHVPCTADFQRWQGGVLLRA
jgi:hypothetical protein